MSQEQIKILVIDDDPAIRVFLKKALTNQGYHIEVATDGEEGLNLAKIIHPDMVICDWLMPKMNGLEVCRCLKNIPEFSSTFFILLTALDSVADRVKGLDAGSDDFLCKPIDIFELQARVRSGLRLHKLNSDLQKQKQILESELKEAADYVVSILPQSLKNKEIIIETKFIPSFQLGGDSFDYYWLDENNIVFYLLDVCGHGLKSALPSLSVIHLLRNQSLSGVNYYQPSSVLQKLNEIFPTNDRQDKYLTIWYGVYNKKSRKLVYGNAGHPPSMLFSQLNLENIKIEKLKNNGFPIGLFSSVQYEDSIIDIKPNSFLYIFSDGIYEIKQENGQISGLDNFLKILTNKVKNQNNLTSLIEDIKSYHNVEIFEDDVSIMAIQFL